MEIIHPLQEELSKVIEIISKIRQTDAASKGFETTGAGANGLLTELVYFILN